MLQRVRTFFTCSVWVVALGTVSGCGTGVYEARSERAMNVLRHEMQKQAAVSLSWADEDQLDENGEVVRPSTGVRYSLPRQLRIDLERNEWPAIPSFVPGEYVLAVFLGELPKEDEKQSGENPILWCYILAEKAQEQDAAPPATNPQEPDQAEQPGGLELHQRVQQEWERALGTFEPAQITQPTQSDYGTPRRFDLLHPRPEDNPRHPQEDVHLYLFPATGDDKSRVQVAIYFHILNGPAQQRELLDNTIPLSLETLAAGTAVPRSASGTPLQTF